MKESGSASSISGADVRRAAMDLLARREHAAGELRRKLNARFRDANELVDNEIQRLTEEGLQSDVRLAEAFVNSRIGKGHGPLKIRKELQQREVSPEIVVCAIEHAGVKWLELAASVLEKRFGVDAQGDKAFNARERGRWSRFLQQRGFTFEQISEVL
jgi:regulatory protein